MSNQDHPAAVYEADVKTVQLRGLGAMIALGLTLGLRLVSACASLLQNDLLHQVGGPTPPSQEVLEGSDTLVSWLAIGTLVLLVGTAVLFLRWLHLSVRLTRGLGGETLPWKPKEAVWAFFIPFINCIRPYTIIRDVHDHLAPELVPEPPVQAIADGTTGYREVKLKVPPPPMKLPHAGIGVWWGAWWVSNIFGNIAMRTKSPDSIPALVLSNNLSVASDVADVVSALLAILMVRALTMRLAERYRRVRHTPADKLSAAQITIL